MNRAKKGNVTDINDVRSRQPAPCEPGSIEQQLDMCETGPMRGDDVLHRHGYERELPKEARERMVPTDEIMNTFRADMSEENREGMEMSGDEHSAGMQGGDSEFEHQAHIDTDMPGEQTQDDEDEQIDLDRRRAA